MKTLVRTNGSLFPAIPTLLDEFFGRDWLDSSRANWKSTGTTLAAVNVLENNDDFKIEVAAPGLKKDDFKVELDNNILTISSQREDGEEKNQGDNYNYTRREFRYQSFQRSFSLPENQVKADKISAQYVDGLLKIVIPKSDEAKIKPAKQIAVS
jgi:HSP20 family protein